jgi:hypothetical protein
MRIDIAAGQTSLPIPPVRDAWTLVWLDVRQVEITDRRRPGQCPCQLVEVTALLAPGEVLLVVLARRPALYQNKVITVIKVSRNFYTLAAILISGVGQDGTKGLYQLQAGALLRSHFQDDDAGHSHPFSRQFLRFQSYGDELPPYRGAPQWNLIASRRSSATQSRAGRRWPALPIGVERLVQLLVQLRDAPSDFSALDRRCGANNRQSPVLGLVSRVPL